MNIDIIVSKYIPEDQIIMSPKKFYELHEFCRENVSPTSLKLVNVDLNIRDSEPETPFIDAIRNKRKKLEEENNEREANKNAT